jgi:general secretion pathway protein M
MKSWFQQQTRREQLMVLIAAGLVAWLLIYAVAWAPLTNSIQRNRVANIETRETLGWMRQAVVDIKQAGTGAGPNNTADAPQSISSLVDTTLPNFQLVMQRYQPTGDDSAQLWLEDAPLAQVVAWLAAMERDFNMRLINVSIASSDKQGVVKTRVRMAQP